MNKKLINEWGAGMPKSNPYANEPKKPYSPKKPNNPWAKSEEPEEDIPVGKREKRFNPNNWKNESRNMNKKLIRLTESDLHRIVKESVERILAENGENEGFFDKFRRTSTTSDALKGLGDSRYNYTYDKDKDRYFYRDEAGNKHDTGIGYGKGNVGSNWNPFKWFNSGSNQVTPEDAKYAQQRLQRWNGDGNKDPFHYSLGDERTSIDRNVKNEREAQRQAERQAQRRREEEKYQYERPHRTGPAKTDQAGHIRAYFDDDAAYDAGLR
jgi:hypothetical protein